MPLRANWISCPRAFEGWLPFCATCQPQCSHCGPLPGYQEEHVCDDTFDSDGGRWAMHGPSEAQTSLWPQTSGPSAKQGKMYPHWKSPGRPEQREHEPDIFGLPHAPLGCHIQAE